MTMLWRTLASEGNGPALHIGSKPCLDQMTLLDQMLICVNFNCWIVLAFPAENNEVLHSSQAKRDDLYLAIEQHVSSCLYRASDLGWQFLFLRADWVTDVWRLSATHCSDWIPASSFSSYAGISGSFSWIVLTRLKMCHFPGVAVIFLLLLVSEPWIPESYLFKSCTSVIVTAMQVEWKDCQEKHKTPTTPPLMKPFAPSLTFGAEGLNQTCMHHFITCCYVMVTIPQVPELFVSWYQTLFSYTSNDVFKGIMKEFPLSTDLFWLLCVERLFCFFCLTSYWTIVKPVVRIFLL